MNSERFYATLPVITDFEAITLAESYAALPGSQDPAARCAIRLIYVKMTAPGLGNPVCVWRCAVCRMDWPAVSTIRRTGGTGRAAVHQKEMP